MVLLGRARRRLAGQMAEPRPGASYHAGAEVLDGLALTWIKLLRMHLGYGWNCLLLPPPPACRRCAHGWRSFLYPPKPRDNGGAFVCRDVMMIWRRQWQARPLAY